MPDVAEIVVRSIFDSERKGLCKIHSYVVMPNHVHALISPLTPLRTVTQFIKGRSAREANLALGREGKIFWQKESFDHWVRNSAEFGRILQYIRNNPVKANLVATPEAWPWLGPKL